MIGIEGDGEAASIKGDGTETSRLRTPTVFPNGDRNGPCSDRLDCERHWASRLDVGSRDALCQGWRGMGG